MSSPAASPVLARPNGAAAPVTAVTSFCSRRPSLPSSSLSASLLFSSSVSASSSSSTSSTSLSFPSSSSAPPPASGLLTAASSGAPHLTLSPTSPLSLSLALSFDSPLSSSLASFDLSASDLLAPSSRSHSPPLPPLPTDTSFSSPFSVSSSPTTTTSSSSSFASSSYSSSSSASSPPTSPLLAKHRSFTLPLPFHTARSPVSNLVAGAAAPATPATPVVSGSDSSPVTLQAIGQEAPPPCAYPIASRHSTSSSPLSSSSFLTRTTVASLTKSAVIPSSADTPLDHLPAVHPPLTRPLPPLPPSHSSPPTTLSRASSLPDLSPYSLCSDSTSTSLDLELSVPGNNTHHSSVIYSSDINSDINNNNNNSSSNMARRQSCSDLPPSSLTTPPYSRPSSPPFFSKATNGSTHSFSQSSSHSKTASNDMRSVKSRLLRNWIGQSGQQEYKVLERSLARFHQKDRYRIEVLKTSLLPWLRKDHPNLDTLSESSLRNGRQLIMQWWTTLLAALPEAIYTDRCHYFDCIVALMTRKEFDEFDRVEDLISKPTTPSTARTFIDGSVTEQTSSTTSISSSTTLGPGYPFTDSGAFWSSFHQYRKMLTQSLQYAIERLNQKGVYSNVITFCAKILALCFFKLPGVALGLLHALPVSRSYISRMAKAMELVGENGGMPHVGSFFPEHLTSICFVGTGSWWREFERQKRRMATGEIVPPMEMFGNWVRRWQSDDSELFFAFYRHYHHCLSHFLGAPLQRIQAGGWATSAITPKVYAGAPGYLYLSAFFLTKIEGLVHREIHPVTTIVQFEPNSANGNSNPGVERDRAMASVATGEFPGTTAPPAVRLPNGSEDVNARSKDGAPTTGKPKVLDMASRRFVETIVSIMEDHGNIYGAMLDVWIRAAVTRTSVYDVESVFCLLDFLDMLISELEARTTIRLYDSELSTVPLHTGPSVTFVPIHVQFILTTLHLLLTSSDHTITLMRTISFIYQNFTLLTGTVQTLEQLTLGTLLSPAVFEKCFLHWARNVRLYYMRCLVWRVARIGGGVGILPGWKGWTTPTVPALDQQSYLAGRGGSGGMMATANAASPEVPLKKKSKEAASVPRSNSLELSLASIVRNIFEVMESRVDMVKRQYSGELLTDLMPRLGDKDPELSPPCSTPSSPNPENGPTTTPAVVVSAGGSPVDPASTRARFSTEGNQEEDSLGASRSFYQLQAQQIYLAHQTLTSPPNSGTKDKEGSKKSSSRSSLIGRKFRRLSRSDGSSLTNTEPSRSNSMDSDATLCESFQNLQAGGGGSSSPKRSSSGSSPSITSPGSLLRWMFLGGQSSNKMGSSSNNGYVGADMNGLNRSVSDRLFSTSSCSLVSRSTDSSTSLSIAMKNSDQSPESSRQQVNSTGQDRRDAQARARASLRYVYESRRYPEHLTIYAERSIPEHTAVLNEYVDWLGQCHAYGIKTRMSYAVNGGLANQGQPGGVPGIGLCSNLSGSSLNNGTGSGMGGNGQFGDVFGDFCIFSLSVGEVMDASAVANHQEEWISPGMAQMMMLRFPGLAVEWPKFWNNSRDLSGPPPGPITTLPALAVVNNPAFSLSKGGAGGIGGGVSAGAGGHFGGTSLNGPYSVNGPSSLRHQQQAQMHHQQQMQLWSRNAAVAAQMAAAQAAQAATHMAQANTVMVSSVGTDEASTRSIQTPQDRFLFSPSALT